MSKTTFRNRIDELLGITVHDLDDMRKKTPKRSRPWAKRKARKVAHESRRRNRS